MIIIDQTTFGEQNMRLAVRYRSEWIFKCFYLISKIEHHIDTEIDNHYL